LKEKGCFNFWQETHWHLCLNEDTSAKDNEMRDFLSLSLSPGT